MKRILLIICVLFTSSIAVAGHLVDKHAAWEVLRVTDSIIFQYLEEQEMGGGHIDVTFSRFSTAYMQRDVARTELGL